MYRRLDSFRAGNSFLSISEHRIIEYLLPFRQIQVSVLTGELVMNATLLSALDGQGFHPVHYWHALVDGRLQCDLCARFCKLHGGQRGFCFVRINNAQQIKLTTWWRSRGFVIDPLEKKPSTIFCRARQCFLLLMRVAIWAVNFVNPARCIR